MVGDDPAPGDRSWRRLWTPLAYNVEQDPREEIDILRDNLWLLGPALRQVYRFLASQPYTQHPALVALLELAWLFAQLELLGLPEADTLRIQRTLAEEFAAAAAMPGLSAEVLVAAVEASPVGLIR